MLWSQGRMTGDRGIAGLRALGILLIVSEDGAAVRAAQQEDNYQHWPGQY